MELAHASFSQQPLLKRLNLADWLYALLVLAAAGYSYALYNHYMDVYEQAILAGSALA